jgi:hypothetical protein
MKNERKKKTKSEYKETFFMQKILNDVIEINHSSYSSHFFYSLQSLLHTTFCFYFFFYIFRHLFHSFL